MIPVFNDLEDEVDWLRKMLSRARSFAIYVRVYSPKEEIRETAETWMREYDYEMDRQ